MTYTEFQDYFYSYYISLKEYYDPDLTIETLESFITPTEATFQTLWHGYVNLFGESFIQSVYPQYEFNPNTVEYFNFILKNYTTYYKSDFTHFIIECKSTSANNVLWRTSLNTQDLESLYNYLSHNLMINSAFYSNNNYEFKITVN